MPLLFKFILCGYEKGTIIRKNERSSRPTSTSLTSSVTGWSSSIMPFIHLRYCVLSFWTSVFLRVFHVHLGALLPVSKAKWLPATRLSSCHNGQRMDVPYKPPKSLQKSWDGRPLQTFQGFRKATGRRPFQTFRGFRKAAGGRPFQTFRGFTNAEGWTVLTNLSTVYGIDLLACNSKAVPSTWFVISTTSFVIMQSGHPKISSTYEKSTRK